MSFTPTPFLLKSYLSQQLVWLQIPPCNNITHQLVSLLHPLSRKTTIRPSSLIWLQPSSGSGIPGCFGNLSEPYSLPMLISYDFIRLMDELYHKLPSNPLYIQHHPQHLKVSKRLSQMIDIYQQSYIHSVHLNIYKNISTSDRFLKHFVWPSQVLFSEVGILPLR